MNSIVIAIVLLPLLAALISGLFCRQISPKTANLLTSSALVLSAICSTIAYVTVIHSDQSITVELFRWFDTGSFTVSWDIYIDTLTAVMLLVVTYVSAAVHIYSIGYMHHDPHVQRFMSYLSLFTFFMLMLVTSDNFLQLFFGWEGVGLCSYLLIGFWYKKPSANAAAMKAFIVNRVGDVGFALGIFAIYMIFDTVNFAEVFMKVPSIAGEHLEFLGYSIDSLHLIAGLLFIGCMGKSAQLGLHTWLPDAMEGPTPVSALIHAATMVTAGVFLVARTSIIFEYAPAILTVVTYVGAATAIFAASIAITQNDIKRIIAYSTCSQLGYMFFACGVSAYSAGIFHLMTHGFFKALLFLGAGSVIHAMSEEQDIRKMGGIWKKIPLTYGLMWVGSLALAGIWPFAGFYSKDIILEAAYASGSESGHIAYYIGILAAFLTAFYSWRLLFLTFHGKPRASHHVMEHIHESPKVMLLPLIFLATGALLAGIYGVYGVGMIEVSDHFWQGSLHILPEHRGLSDAHHVSWLIKYLPLVVGLLGIGLAYLCYMAMPAIPGTVAKLFKPIYIFLLNKWYIDELYDILFVRPIKALGTFSWKVIDIKLIDGLGPNGFAYVAQRVGQGISRVQSGLVYHYALVMLLGMVALVTWYICLILL